MKHLLMITFCVISLFSKIALAEDIVDEEKTENLKESAPSVEKLSSSGEADSKVSPDQYLLDNHGLGFGYAASGTSGIYLYYDYNLRDKYRSQIHTYIFSGSESSKNILGHEIVSLSQVVLGVTYRKLFRPGFFLGAGASTLTATTSYRPFLPDDPNSKYNEQDFIYAASSFDFDLGWQGNDNYYFSVSLKLGTAMTESEEYRTKSGIESISTAGRFSKISEDFNHRSQAESFYETGKDLAIFSLGFGWYIVP